MSLLHDLPLSNGLWEAAYIKLSEHPIGARVTGPLTDAGMVIVVDVANGMVIGSEMVTSGDPATVAESIVDIMREPPMGVPGARPERLQVRDAALRDAFVALSAGAIPDVELVGEFALLDERADAMISSLVSRVEVQQSPLLDDATTAFFFRSAVTFYNAKPWRLLDEGDTLEITFGNRVPITASVTGAFDEEAANIGVTIMVATEDESASSDTPPVIFTTLSLSFMTDTDAPQAWRDLRRLRKWPLASPQAFPVPVAMDDAGISRMPNSDEMRELSVCLNVIAVTVATRRKEIESGKFGSHAVTVRDDRGVAWTATAALVLDDSDANGHAHSSDPRMAPIDEIRDAAMNLPDANRMLDRLMWSFFRGDAPGYARNEEDGIDAGIRFVEWTVFAYRANGKSLAERGLEKLAETRTSDELAMHRRAVVPRVGVFRVESQNEGTVIVRDRRRRETLRVIDPLGAEPHEVGDIIVAMMHEIADDLHVFSPGSCLLESGFDGPPGIEAASPERFAPMLEAALFGATPDWIQEVPADLLPEVYGAFRAALLATGDTLPDFRELERRVALAEEPSHVMSAMSSEIAWWTDDELQVMLSFMMRTWNVTPRKELNGLSPEEVSARRNPPRRAKQGGKRRRR